MKIIYKLPKYFSIATACVVIFIIIRDFKIAKSMNLFDLIEAGNVTNNNEITVLGIGIYWIMMTIGLVLSVWIGYLRRDKFKLNIFPSVGIAFSYCIMEVLGAKTLHGLENVIINETLEEFNMGGQALYGSIYFSFIFVPVVAKLIKCDRDILFDYVAPFGLIALVFIRIGCYFTECCGADTCWIGSVGVTLPVQLFEIIFNLAILQIIFNYETESCNWYNKYIKPGEVYFVSILLYGTIRFVLEFLRNEPVALLGLTYGQIHSILCVLISICYIVHRRRIKS